MKRLLFIGAISYLNAMDEPPPAPKPPRKIYANSSKSRASAWRTYCHSHTLIKKSTPPREPSPDAGATYPSALPRSE